MEKLKKVASANSLIEAFYRRTDKASGWKEPTQKFGCNLLKEVRKLQLEVLSGEYRQKPGSTFKLYEHGRLRLIRALTVRDMVVQHSLCDNILYPELTKFLIHDNGASLKGKGISFTRRRFEQHLHKFFRQHGRDGYVMMIDYRKFFDNIRHDRLAKMFAKRLYEPELMKLIQVLLDAYRVDVSYSDDPHIIDKVFNSLEYQKIDRSLLDGSRTMGKSLGIGAPISQISGIFYPLIIDNYCKTVRGVKFYDAYMDDRIIIHQDKAFLHQILEEVKWLSSKMGLHINENKTQIVPITHGFTFLKTRYLVTESGRIVRKIPRSVVVRERRKLKKLAKFVVDGEMTVKAYKQQYQSWRGDKLRYDAYDTLVEMDKIYRRLLKWTTSRKQSTKSSRKSQI